VLIVVQNLPVPFDRRVWLEATTLQRAGYQVSVISPKLKGWNRSRERIEDVDVYRYWLPINARGTLGYLAEFVWCFVCTALKSIQVAVTGRGFDVIHACNPPDTYWLLGLGWRLLGKRFVFDHHDLAPEVYSAKFGRSRGLIRRVLEHLERMSFESADVVIATNESHRQVAMERGGVPAERIYIVRSGPDLSRFRIYPPEPEWRQGKDFLIAYLGEIGSQDGVENLVRAVRILRDELGRRDFHCVLVGGGPHLETVRRYAQQQGVVDTCTFTGDVSDDTRLCQILSSADLAVVPDPQTPHSDKSTMNKVVEYMFFGLPMVAFDLRENRFSAQGAAVYVGDNSPRAMAECIADLLGDPSRRREMALIGQNRVRDQLAWQHSVPHLLAAYQKALEAR
jgi:glycosyltransferase involved in cell wall biosynthesis